MEETMKMQGRWEAQGVSDVGVLRQKFVEAWSAETSVDPGAWTAECPSKGQCAVTALIVQEQLGGALVRTEVEGVSHYWNQLPSGEEIDLTRDQFSTFEPTSVSEVRSRGYVLSDPDTERRYRVLKKRLERTSGKR